MWFSMSTNPLGWKGPRVRFEIFFVVVGEKRVFLHPV